MLSFSFMNNIQAFERISHRSETLLIFIAFFRHQVVQGCLFPNFGAGSAPGIFWALFVTAMA